MLKKGFTLAEVLITLGVIGVVAAITLPSLLADTATAQIGPKLAKSVSMFEQANESLLSENASDTLIDAGFWPGATYTKELRKYLKGSADGTKFLTKDGVLFTFEDLEGDPTNPSEPAHMQKIGKVKMDINGEDTKPNSDGTDIFHFTLWNDGSLRPKGGTDWDGADTKETWETKCKKDAVAADATFCAGHIFENNFKVYYR